MSTDKSTPRRIHKALGALSDRRDACVLCRCNSAFFSPLAFFRLSLFHPPTARLHYVARTSRSILPIEDVSPTNWIAAGKKLPRPGSWPHRISRAWNWNTKRPRRDSHSFLITTVDLLHPVWPCSFLFLCRTHNSLIFCYFITNISIIKALIE